MRDEDRDGACPWVASQLAISLRPALRLAPSDVGQLGAPRAVILRCSERGRRGLPCASDATRRRKRR